MFYDVTETQSGKQYSVERDVLVTKFVDEISMQIFDNRNVTGAIITKKNGDTIIVRKQL